MAKLKTLVEGAQSVGVYIDDTEVGINLGKNRFHTDSDNIPRWNGEELGKGNALVKFNLTGQMDGITKTFAIDESITEGTDTFITYSGVRYEIGFHYTINYVNHTLTTLFVNPPNSNKGRMLWLYAGSDVASGGGLGGSEVDPIFNSSPAAGITVPQISSWTAAATNSHTHSNKSVIDGITSGKVVNWDEAYGWGNHASAGYLTALPIHEEEDEAAGMLYADNHPGILVWWEKK